MGCKRTLSARAAIVAGALMMLSADPRRFGRRRGRQATAQGARSRQRAASPRRATHAATGRADSQADRREASAAPAPPAPAVATQEEQKKPEALKAADRRGHPGEAPAGARGGEQDVPLAVQPGDRPHHRHRRLVQRARPRRTSSSAPRELGLSAVGRPVRARLRDHQRHDRRLRGRGGGDRHHLAAVQPDGQGRALLRRLRPPVEVPRPRPAVREPADRARRVRRRRVAGRRRRGELARAARAVPDADRRLRTTRSAPRTSASTTPCRATSRSSPTSGAPRRSST